MSKHLIGRDYSGFVQFFVKAFKTFVQGATGTLLAGGLLKNFDPSVLEAAWIGGLSGLISFLNNWATSVETPVST